MNPDALSARVLAGEPRAIARAISLVEDETAEGAALVGRLYSHAGGAYLVGVTGSPGAGKSTLVDRLVAEGRRAGRRVGVLAVDPSSPFTGGAILGDRVRMSAHAGDPDVFIRSMAARGELGGLARATSDAALILDAAGTDLIFVETVGVGQGEVDIVRTADVSVVILVPGGGDDVQAMKAGIMEIADIFVINKADREGADRLAEAVAAILSLQSFEPEDWRPPVLKTQATTGDGVGELWEAIAHHRRHSARRAGDRQRGRHERRLRDLLGRALLHHAEAVLPPGELDRMVDRIAAREIDPYTAVREIVRRALGPGPASDPAGRAGEGRPASRP